MKNDNVYESMRRDEAIRTLDERAKFLRDRIHADLVKLATIEGMLTHLERKENPQPVPGACDPLPVAA
ncbi:MAG TPA: hypothetical protein VM008_20180 [Phycisphaerae bacterium]|nr:hypothetical protein [Phycisphaerae bacterium]